MKKILLNLFIFIAILFCPTLVNAEEYTYTIDNANLLKKDTKEYIDNYSSFLAQNNNFKYFVVTEKQLGVYSLEELADSYFDQLNVGRKGILILYVKDKQALYIEVGKDVSDVINNNVIQNHINTYFLPFLKNQEIDKGILNGYKSLYKVVCNYYRIDSSSMEVYNADNLYEKYKTYIILFLIWINTATTYIICNTIKKFYSKKKKISSSKQTSFIISSVINILVIFISYFINPTTMFIILAFEFFAISSSFSTDKQLDLNEIKRMEYKKEQKRIAKEKAKARKKEALRLKQLRKMQREVKRRNKKRKTESSDLEKMLKRTKHK
ncbi:MAG: TPM domain-containing protein [Bacilli bacterium]|nr:TPM domain-containing protein [Bacilli bacterium]